ncbi:MAG: hypothetical protein ABIF71_14155, partial [Planctomycetota bacterium]
MSRWLSGCVVITICLVAMGAYSSIYADTYGCENSNVTPGPTPGCTTCGNITSKGGEIENVPPCPCNTGQPQSAEDTGNLLSNGGFGCPSCGSGSSGAGAVCGANAAEVINA